MITEECEKIDKYLEKAEMAVEHEDNSSYWKGSLRGTLSYGRPTYIRSKNIMTYFHNLYNDACYNKVMKNTDLEI